MDGRNVEPGHGLHENQPWLRPLLCRTVFGTLPSNAWASVRGRIRSDAAAGAAQSAATLASAAHDFREFHERSLSKRNPAGIHWARLRHHGARKLAHVSGAHQTVL